MWLERALWGKRWEIDNANIRDHQVMLSPSARFNRKSILFAAAMLIVGTSTTFAQGGGAGSGAGGGNAGGGGGGAAAPSAPPPTTSTPPPVVNPSSPNIVPQQSPPLTHSRSATPSTPNTAPGGDVKSSRKEGQPSPTARSKRTSLSKTRSVRHHRPRFAGPALDSHYCGYSPCFRIYPRAFYGYAIPAYSASGLWWPDYYDYAPGQLDRGRPRYGGYARRSGYHGD
jgi:hypothetical protein